MAAIYEIPQSLNILAGTTGLDAQKAANAYAGTTGLELVAALNCKLRSVTTWNAFVAGGFTALDLNGVANQLNGTKTKDAQDALSQLAGGGHTNAS